MLSIQDLQKGWKPTGERTAGSHKQSIGTTRRGRSDTERSRPGLLGQWENAATSDLGSDGCNELLGRRNVLGGNADYFSVDESFSSILGNDVRTLRPFAPRRWYCNFEVLLVWAVVLER